MEVVVVLSISSDGTVMALIDDGLAPERSCFRGRSQSPLDSLYLRPLLPPARVAYNDPLNSLAHVLLPVLLVVYLLYAITNIDSAVVPSGKTCTSSPLADTGHTPAAALSPPPWHSTRYRIPLDQEDYVREACPPAAAAFS
jgi:hypothetical protein